MVTQELIDHIRDSLQNNVSEEETARVLMATGWSQEDVQQAITYIKAEKASIPTTSSFSGTTTSIKRNEILRQVFVLLRKKMLTFLLVNVLGFLFVIGMTIVCISLLFIVHFFKLPIAVLIGVIIPCILGYIFIGAWPWVTFMYLLANDVKIIDSFKKTFPKVLPMICMGILVEFIVLGGFGLFVFPGLIFEVWFTFALLIYLYEGVGGFTALFKSKEYVKGNFWLVAGLTLGVQILSNSLFRFTRSINPIIQLSIVSLFNVFVILFTACITYILYQQLKASKPNLVIHPTLRSKIFLLLFGFIGNIIGISFAVMVLSTLFQINLSRMHDIAMFPTIQEGQLLFVSNTFTGKEKPIPGDIIAFQAEGKQYVRRVIAISGEEVVIRNDALYIDNVKQIDSYLTASPIKSGTFLPEGVSKTIPSNSYFVLGDNRGETTDSREFGFIPMSHIQGRVFTNPLDALTFYLISNRATHVKSPQIILYPTPMTTPTVSSHTITPIPSLWEQTTSFPMKISREAVVAYNGYLYSIGGYSTETQQDTNMVYITPIHSDGTLGSWSSTTPLPQALEFQTAIIDNGYIFAIAGDHFVSTDGIRESNQPNNYVLYAKINADGTLGQWVENATLPSHFDLAGVAVINREIYVSPGCSCEPNFNNLYHDHIYPDEKLSVWDSFPPAPVIFPKLFSLQNKLFAFGHGNADTIAGQANPKYDATLYSTIVKPDGTFGTWTKEKPLPNPLLTDEKVLLDSNNNVYIRGAASNYIDMYVSHLDNSSNLSSWKGIQTGMWDRKSTGLAIYNNYIYLIGGKYYNDDTISYKDAYFTKLNPDGSLVHP